MYYIQFMYVIFGVDNRLKINWKNGPSVCYICSVYQYTIRLINSPSFATFEYFKYQQSRSDRATGRNTNSQKEMKTKTKYVRECFLYLSFTKSEILYFREKLNNFGISIFVCISSR